MHGTVGAHRRDYPDPVAVMAAFGDARWPKAPGRQRRNIADSRSRSPRDLFGRDAQSL